MKYIVTMNGNRFEVEVERVSPFHQLTREEIASGAAAPVAAPAAPAPVPAPAPAPKPAPAPAPAPKPAAPAPAGGAQIVCPMPGTVLAVKAAQGTAVKAGQTVFVVEAMTRSRSTFSPAIPSVSTALPPTASPTRPCTKFFVRARPISPSGPALQAATGT